jgi:acylphosphatase
MMSKDEKIVWVRIAGHVQGVGFRAFVLHEAERLGVNGWVRNRNNGDVEALLAGADAAVEKLIAACRRGPPQARVVNLIMGEPAPGLLAELPIRGFTQRSTI